MILARRPVQIGLVLGLAALAASVVGAEHVLHRSPGEEPAGASTPSDSGTGTIVCFGHVDVEQGVASLAPLVPGRVARVEVREEEPVSAGTVLVRLDDRLAAGKFREAEAALREAGLQLTEAQKLPEQQQIQTAEQKAAIEAVRHRLAAAREVLARKQELVRIEQLNAREATAAAALVEELEALERAEEGKLAELRLHDPDLEVQRAREAVAAKQALLDQARQAREECVLKAPGDGTVLRILVSPGDVLGMPGQQPALLFCPSGPRIIRAEVEQEFAGQVAVGQGASIQDDTSAGTPRHGRVQRVSDWYTHRRSILQEPFQFNDVRTLECIVALDPGQPVLRIGQRVRVAIGPGLP